MDIKEQQIMQHYKELIEKRKFDEYDILGFLIFIRERISENIYPDIKEFAHLIAHRERYKGIINECIVSAIANGYKTIEGSRTVIGYHGMEYETWKREWGKLGKEFNIILDAESIEEITLCVFSLAQFSTYNDKKGRGSGVVKLFVGRDNSLALVTTEGKEESLYVCFSKFGKVKLYREIPAGIMRNPVEAVRRKGELWLKDKDGYILTLKKLQ